MINSFFLFLLLIEIQDLADALRSLDPLGDGTLTFDEFCRGVGSIIQQSPTGKTGIPIFPPVSKPPQNSVYQENKRTAQTAMLIELDHRSPLRVQELSYVL
jgi:hypothetical protein